MLSTMMQYPLTTNYCLERGNQVFGSRRIASRMPDKSIHHTTFSSVYKRSRQLAAALVRAGVKPGDRVAVLMLNHAWHFECYFGIPAAGGVYHPLNFRLSADDLSYIVNDAEDKVLLVDDALMPIYESIKAKVRIERVIVNSLTKVPVPSDFANYESFIANDASDYQYPAIDENDAAGICYTSGTTGRPKGVVYSHRSTLLHSLSIALPDYWGLCARDSILGITPLFHANGWGVPAAAMMVGANMVFPGPHLSAEDILDLMEREQVTMALGVPTIWTAVLNALEAQPKRWKLPHARLMVGGSAAPVSMIEGFDKFGIRLMHGWGMTEMSPVGSIAFLQTHHTNLPAEKQYAIRAKQGVPVPLVELRVMGENGSQPWDGKSAGELQARGPFITGEYYHTERTEEKFTKDGWLRTGDIAVMDGEGYVQLVDRSKDLIKSGGEWISSVDLENAIMAHPAVLEAAVVAVRHPSLDERPLAVVVKKPDKQVTTEELREFLGKKFAKWQIPDDWTFVDALPKTSTGKFMKHKLRSDFKDYVSKTPDLRERKKSG